MSGIIDVDALERGVREQAEAGYRLTGSWNPLLSQAQLDWLRQEMQAVEADAGKAAAGTE